MILKYANFLIGIIWSYSIIKTQSVLELEENQDSDLPQIPESNK